MANEKRLIDANALSQIIMESYERMDGLIPDAPRRHMAKAALLSTVDLIGEIPTVEAVEVVHGRWQNNANDYPECDKCGYMPQYDPMIDDIWYSPYCPNCGAKMDGDVDG